MQRELPYPKDNFDENIAADVAYLSDLYARINSLFSNCNVLWCNCAYQGTGYTRDSRIQFELVGTYYHRDNAGYINEDGTYANTYCIDNYGICKDEVLNVFFCQIPDGTTGYGPPSHVMIFNQYNEYLNAPGGAWGGGNLIGHEFGHVFGLGHSFCGLFSDMCQSETQDCVGDFCPNPETDCTCGNNMMSYSRINDFISPLQMAQMHKTLTLGAVSKYLKTEYTASQDLVIATPTIWDYSRVVFGNVNIKPGASLTIVCRTIMAKGARIVVERGARLIVDGATITTKGPTRTTCNGQTKTERWTGIEVWGNTAVASTPAMLEEGYPLANADPGVVTLKNGAVIENAQIGIFGQQRATPWEVQLLHFGGLISVNNAIFRNCRKGVEYGAYEPITVSSSFKACTFEQTFLGTSVANPVKTYEGVTSWQVSGMLFSDACNFKNLERGLVLGNATATVLGSTFTLNKYAVEAGMAAPTANKKTFIGGAGNNGNTFKYCDWCVSAKSYGFLIVYNNLMEDCYNGVTLQGTSIYKIEENEFRNTTINGNPAFLAGVALFQSGEAGVNSIYCNEYNTVGIGSQDPLIKEGVFVGGNNNGTYWYANKFDCWYDVRLSHLANDNDPANPYKGELPDQGGIGNPVYNEFTDYAIGDHKAEIFTPDPLSNNSESFTYYPPTTNCLSQLLPRCPIQGTCSSVCSKYKFRNIGQDQPLNPPICSFGPIDGLLQPGDCRTRGCLAQYYIQIGQLDYQIAQGGGVSAIQERKYVNSKKMALLHHLTDSLYAANNLSEVALLWAADPEQFSREALVGLRLQTKDYAGAAQLLANYPSADPEDARFKLIQTVNLNRLAAGNTFVLSAQDSTSLYAIAKSYSAQAGYAQTLLWVLHGAMFEPIIPPLPAEPEERSGEMLSKLQAASMFSIYPNPAGEVLNIDIAAEVPSEYRLSIRDAYGRLLSEHALFGDSRINIAHLNTGAYAATVTSTDGKVQSIWFFKSKP
ncbi:MAG: T9SS type A sorting domain-containing protein [Saprospiraceae bacterium]